MPSTSLRGIARNRGAPRAVVGMDTGQVSGLAYTRSSRRSPAPGSSRSSRGWDGSTVAWRSGIHYAAGPAERQFLVGLHQSDFSTRVRRTPRLSVSAEPKPDGGSSVCRPKPSGLRRLRHRAGA